MPIDESNIDLYQALFDKDKDYWTREAVQLEMQNKTSFNIYALLFGVFWFLYRKMYREALIIFFIIIAISYAEEVLLANEFINQDAYEVLSLVITLGTSILLGFLANRLYIWSCQRKVQMIQKVYESEEQRLEALRASGGTNTLLPAIFLVLFLLVNYLVFR